MTNQNPTSPATSDAPADTNVSPGTDAEHRPRKTRRNVIIAATIAALIALVTAGILNAQPQPVEVPAPTPTARFALPTPVKLSPFNQLVANSAQQAGKSGITIVTVGRNDSAPKTTIFDPTVTGAKNQSETDTVEGVGIVTRFSEAATVHTSFFYTASIQNSLGKYVSTSWAPPTSAALSPDGTWADSSTPTLPTYGVGADGLINTITSNDPSNPFTMTITYSVSPAGHDQFLGSEATATTAN